MIGKTIGKYRIVGQLGRGGMGTVYKAVDNTLDREVAIKVLNPELAETEIIKRFRKEAIALAKLSHPEIATIYELFRSETDVLMVMEFVRGETLEQLSQRVVALPPEHVAYLIDKVLSALEHAHRAGIVHCDMKPANVMVTMQGGVKIMDFGIARVRGAEHGTVDGHMMGTPAYMPPEQVLGQQVDARSDLYSVGIMLYRLLAGALPFNADTSIGMVQKQISDEPMPLSVHREGLPDWCEPILQRALAKSPADRFQTAEEFRETIERATGVLKPEAAKAFLTSIADFGKATPSQPGVLERFGLTNVAAATLVVPKHRFALAASLLVLLAAAVTALAIVGHWRSPGARNASLADVSLPAIESTSSSTREPSDAANDSTLTPVDVPAGSAAETTAVVPAVKAVAVPFVFEALALVDEGGRLRERASQVFLVDGRINVKANDGDSVLYTLGLDRVLSIDYSRGRDPIWNGPQGPTQVIRAGGGLGIFRGARHWVSLHIRDANAEFVVLRLGNYERAKSAIAALEERTGHTATILAESQDDK